MEVGLSNFIFVSNHEAAHGSSHLEPSWFESTAFGGPHHEGVDARLALLACFADGAALA